MLLCLQILFSDNRITEVAEKVFRMLWLERWNICEHEAFPLTLLVNTEASLSTKNSDEQEQATARNISTTIIILCKLKPEPAFC